MVAVVAHAVTPLDELGDPLRGPEIGGITMRHGTAQELLEQQLAVPSRESRRSSRRASDLETLSSTTLKRSPPPHHRARRTADSPCGRVQRQALQDQRQRSSPPCFQNLGRSRHTHGHLPARCPYYCITLAEVNSGSIAPCCERNVPYATPPEARTRPRTPRHRADYGRSDDSVKRSASVCCRASGVGAHLRRHGAPRCTGAANGTRQRPRLTGSGGSLVRGRRPRRGGAAGARAAARGAPWGTRGA